jgi:CRP/FNR family cyclic AMP-dependent transcriptional regulator
MIKDSLLKKIFLFKNLNAKEIKIVRSLLKQQTCRPKEKIVEEGKAGESLYIILSGKVSVSRSFDKESFDLTELSPYDFFGEMSLIDDFPTSASIEALTKTTLLKMTRSDFGKLITINPVISSKLWEALAKSLTRRIRKTGDLVKLYFGINKALVDSSAW